MAIQASDVRAAYASPIDFGAQIHQLEKEKEQKQLLEEERAQRQEDRDLKKQQVLSETLSPLTHHNGTYYDKIMDKQLSDYYNIHLKKYLEDNPNATIGQQFQHAKQYVSGVAQQAETAKAQEAVAEQMGKQHAKEMGLDEVSLANDYKKSLYTNGQFDPNAIDALPKKVDDLDFLSKHYNLNDANMKDLTSYVNQFNGSEEGTKIRKKDGSVYEITESLPVGYKFDEQTNKKVPILEQAPIEVTQIVNGVPTKQTINVPLVPKETLATYIGNADANGNIHPHATKMGIALTKLANDLKETDPIAKNMDGQTLLQYAGTHLFSNFATKGRINNITDKEIDRNRTKSWQDETRDYTRAQHNQLKQLEGDKIVKLFNNDPDEISATPHYGFEVVQDGGKVKMNGANLTAMLPDQQLTIGKDKSVQVFSANGKFYKQDYKKTTSGYGQPSTYEPIGKTKEITPNEAANYRDMILNVVGNKKATYTAPKTGETTSKPTPKTNAQQISPYSVGYVNGSVPDDLVN